MRPCPYEARIDEHVGMLLLRDFLRWWRPSAAPGTAARTGVPDDRPVTADEELSSVFGALEPVRAECDALGESARRDANQVIAHAREQAEAIVAQARAAASAERFNAAAEARASGEAEQSAIVAEAERQAGRTRRRATERMPALVDRAVELLERDLGVNRPAGLHPGASDAHTGR